jgi:eukaryotic-like serine/threonine-protein kinase
VVGGLQEEDPRYIGRYRLVGRLGCGGMGRVFLGLSAGGRPVAVKVIRAELAADQEFRIRFSREVAAARRVSGLFTALVVDADVNGPVPWLATAYVTGPSLSDAVSSHGPVSARPALALAAGLAEALSAIHAASVVHCDLKPANVLLSPDGPRVIDFGISRATEAAPVTGTGLVVGSPGFMSPEQAMGETVGPPSDVFSLGAILVFAVTGRGPFGEGSRPELAYRLVYRPPGLDLVPSELRPLVEQCLVKDPSQRPTAKELLAEVGTLQAATGWLPDLALGASAEYYASSSIPPPASLAAMPAAGRALPPGQDRRKRRRLLRPVAAAGVAAGVLAASAAVSFALAGAARHPPAAQPDVASSAMAGRPSSAPVARPASPSASASRSSTPAAIPAPVAADITPAMDTVTSPGTRTSPSTSPSASPSAPASPTASASPSPTPSPVPSLSPSPAPPVPRITGAGTYQQGAWVYFDVYYVDPGQDAQGFGFTGSNGQRWVEGQYPFSSPHGGIVGPDSIAYPIDLQCGTARQHKAEVEAWIYDTAGVTSQPVVINLTCTP